MDVVTANQFSDDLSILFGDASGGFENAMSLPICEQPQAILVTDLDLDGVLDLVVRSDSEDAVFVVRGLGARSFEAPYEFVEAQGPGMVAHADVDGDGFDDIVLSGAPLTVLISDRAGGYQEPSYYLLNSNQILASDIDRDGMIDIVAPRSDPASILLNVWLDDWN